MTAFSHLAAANPAPRRFNVVLPAETFSELNQLASQCGRTPAEVVQTALDLLKVADDETFRGNVLAIATRDGRPLRQIVIPH